MGLGARASHSLCEKSDGGSRLALARYSSLFTGSTSAPMFARNAASPPSYSSLTTGRPGWTPNVLHGCVPPWLPSGTCTGSSCAFGMATTLRTELYSALRSWSTQLECGTKTL